MRLLIPILFISVQCFSQEMSCEGGKAHVLPVVVEMPDKSAAEIYKLANRWVAKTFHNKDKVIQSTLENEMIRGDGYEGKMIKIAMGVWSDFGYTFLIEIKEGKLRFSMDNFKIPDVQWSFETFCKNDGSVRSNAQAQNAKKAVEDFTHKLIASLTSMQNEKGDDW